jgi:hypothetical protein
MYERFTDRARKVMKLANEEAQRLRHEYIGTEHILLGLIKEGNGVGTNVLRNLDVDLHKVRLAVEELVGSGPNMVADEALPLTPRTKKALEYAMREACDLDHNYVGTEHILLGLLREDESVAAQILMNLGLRLKEVREEVLALLSHGTSAPAGGSNVSVRITDWPEKSSPEPPAACPKCGQPVVRVLWNWVYLWGQKDEAVRSGKAILGFRHGKGVPPWVCLHCQTGWSEVHKLAMQEWQWQLAKEEAVATGTFEKAAWYRDLQNELNQRLSAVLRELLKAQ